jgi:light-regulated signal transduction histidine kinase (bacteriophytochrome)
MRLLSQIHFREGSTSIMIPEAANQKLETQIIARNNTEEEIRMLNEKIERRIAERTRHLEESNRKLGKEIAQQKLIEAALRDSEASYRTRNHELEQSILSRTAEAEAASRELDAFVYSVSHDLKAPLRQVQGFSKILEEELGPRLEAAMLQYLLRILQGCDQMGFLIDSLVKLSRLGRQKLIKRSTNLNVVVDEVLATLAKEFGGREIEWRIGSLPLVECDPSLMREVFAHLLSNALKFTRQRPRAIIQVDAMQSEARPVFFVRDNGVGFNMKYADKLFGVFQRLHRPEDFEGVGIGLAIVQRVVRNHGGQVWAEAQPEQGATFYFSLHEMVRQCHDGLKETTQRGKTGQDVGKNTDSLSAPTSDAKL